MRSLAHNGVGLTDFAPVLESPMSSSAGLLGVYFMEKNDISTG